MRLPKNHKYLRDETGTEAKKELQDGIMLLKSVKNRKVTFFGGHNLSENTSYYKDCEELAYELGLRDYCVMTGGGPGIMRAANAGAMRAGVPSIGLREGLLHGEHVDNRAYTHIYAFKYMFVRRFILSIDSDALIVFPGGYGTLNELFEYITLIETGIMDRVPIILVNRDYWQGLFAWIADRPARHKFLTKESMKVVQFADDAKHALRIVSGGQKPTVRLPRRKKAR